MQTIRSLLRQLGLLLFRLRYGIRTPDDVVAWAVKKYGKTARLRDQNRDIGLADLYQRVIRLANGLTKLPLEPGACVAVLLENSIEYLEIRLACYKAGLIFCGLIEDFTEADSAQILREIHARVFIFDQRLTSAGINRIKQDLPNLHLFTTAHDSLLANPYQALLIEANSGGKHFAVDPTAISAIGFTSGTGGKSKAVVWSHQAWLHSFYHLILNAAPRRSKMGVFLHVMPFTTSGSLTLLPAIASGCDHVIINRFDAARVTQAIHSFRVTDLLITPSFMIELWDYVSANQGRYDFSSLCCVNIGSAPLAASKLVEFTKTFGPIFRHGYGMAEVLAPLASYTALESDFKTDLVPTVGNPIPQIKLKLADLKSNQMGRIAISSKTCALGYWENGCLTNFCLKNGWFFSSDWGYLDKAGKLYVVDRAANLIRRDNASVFAREIEEVIHRYSGIKDVCVSSQNNLVYAWFSERSNHRVDLAQLVTFCQNHLPAAHVPDCFIRLQALPLSSSGKILRYKLETDQPAPLPVD